MDATTFMFAANFAHAASSSHLKRFAEIGHQLQERNESENALCPDVSFL